MGQHRPKIGPRCHKAQVVKNSKNPRVSGDGGGAGRPSFSFAEACEAEAECHSVGDTACGATRPWPDLRAAAPAADPGSKYGGLATFGYLLKQGNLGTNLRNILIAPCES